MATSKTKTTAKAPAAPKKTAPKKVSRPASTRATSSQAAKNTTTTSPRTSQSMSIASLQKRVMDPKNRRSLFIAICILLLAIIVYFGKGFFVAALVNGEPVSRIAIISDLEKQYGKAAVENVITRKIIFQEASKKKIEVSEKDIDAEIDKIRKQFQAQGQNLDQLIAAQGLTTEKFREEVKVQIIVTKILGDQVKVTDKEFNEFLEKNKDLVENEADQNAAKAGLRQQMEQQKLAQKYQEWMTKTKDSAKVQYFVNY